MPSDDPSAERWLDHIRHNIILAQRFVGTVDYETFCSDELHFYAVTRCLEIISEASRRLPDQLKSSRAEMPWAEMAAAGNIYRHEYEDVQHQLVWATVIERLPALLALVEAELRALGAKF